ncbi:Transglutaminase [Planctomycetales bacterium 10988]|nr:Transglutaminase [Planctomycetales bacterium 10988]
MIIQNVLFKKAAQAFYQRQWGQLGLVMLALGALSACTSTCLGQAQPTFELTPQMPYSSENSDPIQHTIDFSVVVTPPYHCEVLKVWLPIPQTNEAQQIGASQFSTFPMNVDPQVNTEPVYGNKFAYFEFHHPQGAQIIRHRFAATIWNQHWNVDLRNIRQIEKWPNAFSPYLKPQPLTDESQFRELLLKEVVPVRQGGAKDLPQVISWIDDHLQYDHVNASLKADANHALSQRVGHCSDYHGLCATMGRALGFPTRVTYGLAMYPKNSPSHCKMEAFIPPYGWVSFDLSETQKLAGKIQASETLSEKEKQHLVAKARQRLISGFRENSWLLMTKGTDYELVPRATQPVRVVRTAYIEADGEVFDDPDPANIEQREFSWMTVHQYQADKPFKFPFKDHTTLQGN